MLSVIDTETIEKNRRSLTLAAMAVLFLGSISFTNDSMTIFGLGIKVSQERLLLVGQLVTGLLLALYLTRIFVIFLTWLPQKISQMNETWATNTQKSFPDLNPPYDDDMDPMLEDWEEDYHKAREIREKWASRIDTASRTARVATLALADHIIPVSIGIIGAFFPRALNWFLDLALAG